MRSRLSVIVLVLNLLVLVTLSLVPIAALFDLAPNVKIPDSAVVGLFLAAAPSCVAAVVIAGSLLGVPAVTREWQAQLSLILNVFTTILMVMSAASMYRDGRTDLLRWSVVGFVVYGLNTVVFGRHVLGSRHLAK